MPKIIDSTVKPSSKRKSSRRMKGKASKSSVYSSIKSDALFKSIMEDKIAAKEFLECYLPLSFKNRVDLDSVKIEKESYVEDDLKRRLSDVVYSLPLKTNSSSKDKSSQENVERAFVYVLLEQQSQPDHWIALRLWKYTLLLCERHMKENAKLPLVLPILFYNGKKKYSAPRNIWDLFTEPTLAHNFLSKDYLLIDLQSLSNDDIKKKNHLGMMEYFMKHIHTRDMLKLWEDFLTDCSHMVLLDKEKGYIYIKKLLWYTDTKVEDGAQDELNKLIIEHLPYNDGEGVMRTIADKYIEQGLEQGLVQGVERTAINMLRQHCSIELIESVTGLTQNTILKLRSTL